MHFEHTGTCDKLPSMHETRYDTLDLSLHVLRQPLHIRQSTAQETKYDIVNTRELLGMHDTRYDILNKQSKYSTLDKLLYNRVIKCPKLGSIH